MNLRSILVVQTPQSIILNHAAIGGEKGYYFNIIIYLLLQVLSIRFEF